MHETKLKTKILLDILAMKQSLLQQVLSITENQESVLLCADTSDELNMLFSGMNVEKQKLIDEVIQADNVFQSTFDALAPRFEQFANENPQIIDLLQQNIKATMDLDVKIRVLEQRNKEQSKRFKKGNKIELPKASKAHILKQYKKHSQNNGL